MFGHGTELGIQGLEKQVERSHQQYIWAQDCDLCPGFQELSFGHGLTMGMGHDYMQLQ